MLRFLFQLGGVRFDGSDFGLDGRLRQSLLRRVSGRSGRVRCHFCLLGRRRCRFNGTVDLRRTVGIDYSTTFTSSIQGNFILILILYLAVLIIAPFTIDLYYTLLGLYSLLSKATVSILCF